VTVLVEHPAVVRADQAAVLDPSRAEVGGAMRALVGPRDDATTATPPEDELLSKELEGDWLVLDTFGRSHGIPVVTQGSL
jgi:hypothetical protein